MKKVKAVLFDFDDTLFDHRYCSRNALQTLLNRYDFFNGTSLDEIEQENIKILEEVHLNSVLTGKLSLEDARAERFRRIFESYGAEAPEKIMYEAGQNYRKVYESSVRLVSGALHLLENLKGKVKICVVTNNLINEQKNKIRNCGIDDLIDELVTSEEVGYIKPGPEIFYEALNRTKTEYNEVLMVGDSWERDIIGASNIGIKCIWINVFSVNCPDRNLAVEVKNLGQVHEIILNHL